MRATLRVDPALGAVYVSDPHLSVIDVLGETTEAGLESTEHFGSGFLIHRKISIDDGDVHGTCTFRPPVLNSFWDRWDNQGRSGSIPVP